MTTDRRHIRRIRQAIERVAEARRYAQTSMRALKAAEAELKAAVKAATAPQKPLGDGERA